MGEASLRFRALNALTSAKFGLIRGALAAAGKSGLAAKVADGCKAWSLYAGGRMDFNLRFSVARTSALAARLPADEAADFRCLWRAEGGGDGWGPYLAAYFQGIAERHFPRGSASGSGGAAAAGAPDTKRGGCVVAPPPLLPSATSPAKPAQRAFLKAAVVPVISPAGAGSGGGSGGGAPVPATTTTILKVAPPPSSPPYTPSTLAAKASRLLTRPLSALSMRKLVQGLEE